MHLNINLLKILMYILEHPRAIVLLFMSNHKRSIMHSVNYSINVRLWSTVFEFLAFLPLISWVTLPIVMSVACLSVDVIVPVRLYTYLRNNTSMICQILSACYLWPWLGLASFDDIVISHVLPGVDTSCDICNCTQLPGIVNVRRLRRTYRLYAYTRI